MPPAGRLFADRHVSDQDDRRARPARLPPPVLRQTGRRRLRRRFRKLRPRRRRRFLHPRRKGGRNARVRRPRRAIALRRQGRARALHLRIHLLCAAGFGHRRHLRARSAPPCGQAARRSVPRGGRRRGRRARFGHRCGARLCGGGAHPLRYRPCQEQIHRQDVHRARGGAAAKRRAHQAQSPQKRRGGQARGAHRRLHRPRHHHPQDRDAFEGGGRTGSAPAHLLAALPVPLLLRHRYRLARKPHRLQISAGGDRGHRRRRFPRLSSPRKAARNGAAAAGDAGVQGVL